jgi:hypothetical protein
MKKNPIIYIEHMSACISRIKEYTDGIDEDGFLNNHVAKEKLPFLIPCFYSSQIFTKFGTKTKIHEHL